MVDHLERHNANVARACTSSARSRRQGSRARVTRSRPSSTPPRATRSSSPRTRRRRSTWSPTRWPGRVAPLEIGEGDEVVITEMEHHSNIVPWQLLTERKGARLRWFGITDDGRLDLSNIDELINERTKVVSLTWVSNMLGTVNPVAEIARARTRSARSSSSTPRRRCRRCRWTCRPRRGLPGVHRPQGHRTDRHRRALGPAGAARAAAAVPRWRRDDRHRLDGALDVRRIPHKFEAGTPPIVEAVGLGAAVDYLSRSAWTTCAAHEEAITAYALDGLASVRA